MKFTKFSGYVFAILFIFFFTACNKVDVDYSASSLNNLKFKLVGENSSNTEIKLYRNQVFTIDYRKKDKITSDLKIKFEYSLIDNTKWKVSDILADYKSEDTLKSTDDLLKFRMQVQATLPTNEFMNLKVKFTAEDNSVEFVPSELVIKIDNSTQPPTAVTITSPPSNSYINASNQNNFEITGTCASGNTIELSSQSPQSVVLFPGPLPCLGNTFTTGFMDISGFFDGTVQIDIKQKNQLGEVSPVTSLNLSKDTILPALAVTSHSDYDIIDTSSTSTFTVSGTCSESGSEVKITGDITSLPNPLCNAGVWSTTLDTVGLVDGNINLVFKHFDSAGNQNASLTRTLVKSSSGIVALLSSKPSAFTNQNTLSVNVSGSGIVAYKYALGKEISCSSAVYSGEYSIGTPITKMTDVMTGALTTSTLSSGDGTYVLCVLGKNSSSTFQSVSTASTYAWVYDSTAPVVGTIDDGIYLNSSTATPIISWSGISDATSGIDSYYIAIGTYSGGLDILTWTNIGIVNSYTTSLPLNYGSRYYATLKIVDKAGNSNYLYGDGWWAVQPLSLSQSNVSLITGESYSLATLLSGGKPSYSGTSGTGFLNASTLIYSAPLSSSAMSENVTLTDSAGQNILLNMKVRAFQDKLSEYGYQGTSGQIYVNDLKAQPITGHFFSANIEMSNRGYWTWVVKKSTDNGNSWNLIDSYNFESGSYSEAKGIAFDSSGNIYVVGNANDVNGITHWIIRKSTDSGITWNTITNFQWETGSLSNGRNIIITNTNKIYSVGYGISTASGGVGKWLVLQMNLDGSGLSVVDQYSTGLYFSAAESIVMDNSGNLYATGSAATFTGAAWVVRKSSDGGSTWSVVDSFQPNSTYSFFPKNIKGDSIGNIYVVGYGYFGVSYSSWVVRKSSDGGITWTNSDVFNAYASKNARAVNLEIDSSSNVYVVGSVLDIYDNTYLVVRKFNGSAWNTSNQLNLSSSLNMGQLSGIVIDGANISSAGYFYDSSNKSKMAFIQSNNYGSSWPTINQYLNDFRPNNEMNDIVELAGGLFSGGYQADIDFIKTWHVKKSSDSGQTWNVIDNYKLSVARNSAVNAFTVNSSTNALYSVGFAEDSFSIPHWTVRKSLDFGDSWITTDDFNQVAGYASSANAAYFGSGGALFVVGEAKVNFSDQKWIVRKSSDDGATWNTVDSYNSTGYKASANAVSESLGNIVVAGSDQQVTGVKATIRYSTNGGTTWTFGDQFVYSPGRPAAYKTMTRDSLGNLYVSGHVEDSSGVARWIIRKSTTGGATWSTVVDLNFVVGKNSEIHKLSSDTLGNIYAAGEFTAADNSRYWILRKSSDYGVTWVTIDKKAISDMNSSTFKAMTPCLSDRLCSGISVEESLFKGKKWLLRILSP